jgi:hypothetical protein
MEIWMYKCRITALNESKWKVDNTLTKNDFDKLIPPRHRWKADNYNHLFEQPTQFYAVCMCLALLRSGGSESRLDVGLAWGYVGMRVLHSVVHASVNPIMTRFKMFLGMSGVLALMTVRAGLVLLDNLKMAR